MDDGSFEGNFKSWLENQHRNMAYKGKAPGVMNTDQRGSSGAHSLPAEHAIDPIARDLGDSYRFGSSQVQGARLSGISEEGSIQVRTVGSLEFVNNPNPKYYGEYLRQMEGRLTQFREIAEQGVSDEALTFVAQYYQYGINAQMFEKVNQSLLMNQVNAMLKKLGLKPISHGVMDFAGQRLQPENFTRYFIDEVKAANPELVSVSVDQAVLSSITEDPMYWLIFTAGH